VIDVYDRRSELSNLRYVTGVFDTPHEQNRSKDGDGRIITPIIKIKH
jgi:hypothetical protein